MTRRSLEPVLTAEAPYQLVMVGALVELLLLGALLPRIPGVAPVCFEILAGVRLTLLFALAGLLAAQPEPPRVLAGCSALALWGALLLPPELWAFALEARAGFPLSALTSILFAVGFYAALRVHRALGWGYALVFVTAVAMQGWRLEPIGGPLLAPIALAVVFVVVAARREPRALEVDAVERNLNT
jgi:hypothetical protein